MTKVYHFIGIGGSGMGPLASLMLTRGYSVQGSDNSDNEITSSLRQQGARIFIGQNAEHIAGADVVVYSSAVRPDNPERQRAAELKLPLLRRAELLAELMNEKKAIAIAGAHGKTTTSSMVSYLLAQAGLNPTTMVGGYIPGDSYNALVGDGEFFVAEVDESDGSFLLASPTYAIITNIDFEHMDYYKSWENLLAAYRKFIGQVKPDGVVIVCGEDENLCKLARESGRKVVTYGLSAQYNVSAENIRFDEFRSRFQYQINGSKQGEIECNVPGRHNVINALGCIALASLLSVDKEVIHRSLGTFHNVRRRFQLKGKINDITVIDDYGHHPTEVKATIETARNLNQKRVITVFQPHRFSRTQLLMRELVQSLCTSDYLIVTDIYEASEKPIEGVTTQVMFEQIKKSHTGHVVYLPKEKITKYLLGFVERGDVVLTLGAGDIYKVGDDLVKHLKQNAKSRIL